MPETVVSPRPTAAVAVRFHDAKRRASSRLFGCTLPFTRYPPPFREGMGGMTARGEVFDGNEEDPRRMGGAADRRGVPAGRRADRARHDYGNRQGRAGRDPAGRHGDRRQRSNQRVDDSRHERAGRLRAVGARQRDLPRHVHAGELRTGRTRNRGPLRRSPARRHDARDWRDDGGSPCHRGNAAAPDLDRDAQPGHRSGQGRKPAAVGPQSLRARLHRHRRDDAVHAREHQRTSVRQRRHGRHFDQRRRHPLE